MTLRLTGVRLAPARCAAIACLALIGTSCTGSSTGGSAAPGHATGGRTSPPPSAAAKQVGFQGVSFTLPSGWRQVRPGCGIEDKTVSTGVWTGSCPVNAGSRATAVSMTAVFGRQFALSWPGHRITWHGQPAWLARHRDAGMSGVRLTLPLLNASVLAQSPEPARARRLLDNLHVQGSGNFAVPADADGVFIQSLAGHDGDGLQRNRAVTDPADVRMLLSDLRALHPVTERACTGSWWPSTALLTFHGSAGRRTYAARFDSCGQVFSGTGASATSSTRLLADVRRLVANSGL